MLPEPGSGEHVSGFSPRRQGSQGKARGVGRWETAAFCCGSSVRSREKRGISSSAISYNFFQDINCIQLILEIWV